jgi:hypothetical protein
VIASVGVILILALGARLALTAIRRAFAAELVGEISEILELIDSRDVERKLVAFSASHGARPVLARLPLAVFETSAVWMPILGLHAARVAASFYASTSALNEELAILSRAPSSEPGIASDSGAASRLRHTVELGEEALCVLREIVARRRRSLICRS